MKLKLPLFVLITFSLLMLFSNNSTCQTIVLEDFEGYENTESLTNAWQISGDVSVDYQLVVDSTEKLFPGGVRYLQYNYNSKTSTEGGFIGQKDDVSSMPVDVSAADAGFQFYLKGDGTDNVIYFQFYQYSGSELAAIWRSQPVPIKRTTWQIVRVPFTLDVTRTYGLHLSYSNGTILETKEDMEAGLSAVGKIQIHLDSPVTTDGAAYQIYFDDFRAMEFFPPSGTGNIKIVDFEQYKSSTDFMIEWQGFGYGTLDYYLERSTDSPEGYKNALWVIEPEDRTTWGMAFRSRSAFYKIPDMSSIAADGGIQFLLKGDGTEDQFLFRFTDANNNYWGSYWMSLEDTSWHLVKVPFVVDTLKGFRWLGNDPNGTYWTSDIGTTEGLRESLNKMIEVRWDKRNPVHDEVRRNISIDALYAVNKFPALPAEEIDDFETYADADNLKTSWNQFGTGSVSIDLSDDKKSGKQAVSVSYNGVNGYTAIRKRNIIPGLNFSELKGGIQFWLKGDGSNNSINFRLQSGNEMWESAAVSLSQDTWQHVGILFSADSVHGFRYLGNNPDEPIWSTNIGTDAQLYGDIANIDQVRFYVRDPEAVDAAKTLLIDNVEGVDVFDADVVVSVNGQDYSASPIKYNLEQNYPNPFNPSTTIQYSVNAPGIVTLKVYNVIGQEVAALVNEYKEAGNHHISFNASNLASGVYIYQLRSGSFVGSKKMLLMK